MEKWSFLPSGYAGSRPILGTIGQDTFKLQKRQFYRNSFAPQFYGHLRPWEHGTILEGEFKMHPSVRVFMLVWFSFLALFIIIALVSLTVSPKGVHDSSGGLLVIPIGLEVFGVALVIFGQRLARGEQGEIEAFLRSTLEATEAPGQQL
jgi:hypothetical protein